MSDDAEQLARALRAGGEAAEKARGEAFRRVFDSELGRFAAATILVEAGIGLIRGPELEPRARAYHDGAQDLALKIIKLAGFDQASVSVTLLDASDELEGRTHERDDRDDFGGPDADPGLDD